MKSFLQQGVRHHCAERLFIFASCLATLFCSCNTTTSNAPQRTELQGEAQGTYYSIVYYDTLGRDMRHDVDSILAAFDSTASLWVEQSLINRVNESQECEVNAMFADLFQKSQQICAYTGGAFDCRVGKLVTAMGFANKQRVELTAHTIDSLLAICRGRVWLDTSSSGTIVLHKELAATSIDFNAIAQGYSVDIIGQHFESLGIANYLVDVGGEVRCRGTKPGGELWQVAIERPSADKFSERQIDVVLSLRDLSLVTSGSYRKYYEVGGVRYSHTIDPATGRSVQHSTLSASVVDTLAWRADALATAFMVMGKERAQAWLSAHPEVDRVHLIFDAGDSLAHFATPALQQLVSR